MYCVCDHVYLYDDTGYQEIKAATLKDFEHILRTATKVQTTLMPKGILGIAHLSEKFEEALLPKFPEVRISRKRTKSINIAELIKKASKYVITEFGYELSSGPKTET